MKQEAFLKALERALHRLKRAERARYLESYRELIADMIEGGMTEEEAVKKQGDAQQIAQEILENAAPSEKSRDIRGIVLAVASAFLLGVSLLTALRSGLMRLFGGNTIGIIGGADGPTAIFVTGPGVGSPLFVYLPTVLVVAVTIFYFVKKRR